MSAQVHTSESLAIAALVSAALECAHTAAYESAAITADAIPSILGFADRQTDATAARILRVIAASLAPEASNALSFVVTRLAQHSYRVACEAAASPFAASKVAARVTMSVNRDNAIALGLGSTYDQTLATLQPPAIVSCPTCNGSRTEKQSPGAPYDRFCLDCEKGFGVRS